MRAHRGSFPSLCSVLRHVPGITPGIWLLWPLLTSAQSHHMLPYDALCSCCFPAVYFARIDRQPFNTPRLVSPVAWLVVNPTAWSIAPLGRSPRIRTWTFTMQPRYLPYLLNPGLCYVVLTYPETGPYMPFLFVGSQFWTRASFRQLLAKMPLPSASILVNMFNTLTGFTYRGLSPH